MYGDSQNVGILFYILCFEVIIINSTTSTLWKLNSDKTKIEANPFHPVLSHSSVASSQQEYVADNLFDIITSTEHFGQSWVKQRVHYCCVNCENGNKKDFRNDTNNARQVTTFENLKTKPNEEVLDCGKPVNFTYYDNLIGILNRGRHPIVPESQAILYFNKHFGRLKSDLDEIDIEALERKLKKEKTEKPKSVHLYNQIGNFWRIKGDANKAIECFRKALAISSHNAEVLLNLAKVLFSLQYLDEAIYLTRRSLDLRNGEKKVAWQQHFTLGEIFKAYGHYQEASLHLRLTLNFNPDYEPAHLALKEMESMPAATIHIYTLVIIVCLVLGVLLVILSSVDSVTQCSDEIKPQRHFNKAMAMRSLRGITMSTKRSKKPST